MNEWNERKRHRRQMEFYLLTDFGDNFFFLCCARTTQIAKESFVWILDECQWFSVVVAGYCKNFKAIEEGKKKTQKRPVDIVEISNKWNEMYIFLCVCVCVLQKPLVQRNELMLLCQA